MAGDLSLEDFHDALSNGDWPRIDDFLGNLARNPTPTNRQIFATALPRLEILVDEEIEKVSQALPKNLIESCMMSRRFLLKSAQGCAAGTVIGGLGGAGLRAAKGGLDSSAISQAGLDALPTGAAIGTGLLSIITSFQEYLEEMAGKKMLLKLRRLQSLYNSLKPDLQQEPERR